MRVLSKLFYIFLGWSIFSTVSFAQESEQPCILFLFADDLTYNAIGKASNGQVLTPQLDRLKDQGASFTHTFNPGSWTPAVCQASRTMLETGRTVWKAQRYNGKKNPDALLWSKKMKEAGYDTYFAGKWHIPSLDPKNLFDHTGSIRPGMPKQTEAGYSREFIPGKKDKWQPDNTSFGGYWEGGEHWTEVTAKEACGFIKQASKNSNPFFMYISFNAPHDPRQSPKKYLSRYVAEKIALPPGFMPKYPYCEEIGAAPTLRDERLAPFPRTKYSIQVNRKEYYSLITHLDEQIGHILTTLRQNCKRPVYIFFTADQGLSVGDHGFMGKQNLYDPSIRVPFLAAGPGIKPGQEIATPIYLQSVMPTCLEIAGLPEQKEISYPSLLSQLHGKNPLKEQDVYGGMFQSQRMILTKQWKMLIYPKAGVVRLYNRISDPHEMNDIANNPEHIPVMDDLFGRLLQLQKQHDDTLNLAPVYKQFVSSIK